jgi:c-di-GMP-related signal transduction protein
MSQVVSSIPLTDDVVRGLTIREGKIGLALNTVIAVEQGNWEQVLRSGLLPETLKNIYLESIKWATILTSEVYGEHKE